MICTRTVLVKQDLVLLVDDYAGKIMETHGEGVLNFQSWSSLPFEGNPEASVLSYMERWLSGQMFLTLT